MLLYLLINKLIASLSAYIVSTLTLSLLSFVSTILYVEIYEHPVNENNTFIQLIIKYFFHNTSQFHIIFYHIIIIFKYYKLDITSLRNFSIFFNTNTLTLSVIVILPILFFNSINFSLSFS